MSATLALASPTTQDRKVRNPPRICADVKACEAILARAESPRRTGALLATRLKDRLYEELVSAVLAENPGLAEAARYKARVAETAHQAFLEGAISLEVRNRHATAAADKRALVLALADQHLKAAKCGYMANGGVKELHRVA